MFRTTTNQTRSRNERRRRAARLCPAAIALAAFASFAPLGATPASAQVGPIVMEGETPHDFSFTVNGSVEPIVRAKWFAHAWAMALGNPPCEDSDVKPPFQSVTWHNSCSFGRSYGNRQNEVETSRRPNTGREDAVVDSALSASTGGTFGDIAIAAACDPNAYADAEAEIVLSAFAPIVNPSGTIRGWTISGTMQSKVRISQVEGRAYGFALTGLEIKGGREARNGEIRWKRAIHERVMNSLPNIPRPRNQRDPIEYEVTNLNTGDVFEGEFFSMWADFPVDTDGYVNWDNDVLEITAQDVDFFMAHTHPAVSPQGHLQISVRGGVVVASSDSGMYAGMAPPVGVPVPLLFPIPQDLQLAYDLGNFNGDPLEVILHAGGSTEFDSGVDVNAPCPADVNGDGQVNPGDLALVLGSWGGPGPVGDVNGDGIINAADLAVVLGSWGPCP